MPLTPDVSARDRALALKGLTKDDIDPDEMDKVIMRIFKELRRQLSTMEAKGKEELEPADRERHARTLANLERTMERLTKLHSERVEARNSKAKKDNDREYKEFLRDLVRRIDAERMRRRAQESKAKELSSPS